LPRRPATTQRKVLAGDWSLEERRDIELSITNVTAEVASDPEAHMSLVAVAILAGVLAGYRQGYGAFTLAVETDGVDCPSCGERVKLVGSAVLPVTGEPWAAWDSKYGDDDERNEDE
jgi:hypothetical protein